MRITNETYHRIGMVIGVVGLVIVAMNAGWAALGVLLALWGNNIQRTVVLDDMMREVLDLDRVGGTD